MNSRIKTVLAGVMCAAACALGRADPATGAAAVSPGNAPVVENTVMGPAPSAEHVWMPGRWISEGGQWKWIAAHWELPPSRSAVWVPGHWVPQGGQWSWVNGAWNAAEVPQSPAFPPQPPGPNAAAGQNMPMPNFPAPYVGGPYVQGAQQPAEGYQPPIVADYGPVDYSLGYYPDYYWAVDPWAWGFYDPLYVGLGWGWGFGGYGYWGHGGYYGHGGGNGYWSHAGSVGRFGSGGFGGHFGGHGR